MKKFLEEQSSLMEFYRQKRPWFRKTTDEDYFTMTVFALIDEGHEMLRLLNWKPWKNKHPLDIGKLKEESIDVLHFLLQIFVLLRMDEDEIWRTYKNKVSRNRDRQINSKEYAADELDNYGVDETNEYIVVGFDLFYFPEFDAYSGIQVEFSVQAKSEYEAKIKYLKELQAKYRRQGVSFEPIAGFEFMRAVRRDKFKKGDLRRIKMELLECAKG